MADEELEMSKYLVCGLDGDPSMPMLTVAFYTVDMGPFILTAVGEGNPYFVFSSLPMELLMAEELGANFNTAQIASSNYQTNRINANAMYANPPTVGADNDGINVVWKVA